MHTLAKLVNIIIIMILQSHYHKHVRVKIVLTKDCIYETLCMIKYKMTSAQSIY